MRLCPPAPRAAWWWRSPDGEHARLKAAGVSIDLINDARWGRWATLRDSQGNGLGLQQAR